MNSRTLDGAGGILSGRSLVTVLDSDEIKTAGGNYPLALQLLKQPGVHLTQGLGSDEELPWCWTLVQLVGGLIKKTVE